LELYYCITTTGNFGDDINEWIWKKLLPDCWEKKDDTTFIAIGTILDVCIPDTKNKVVFGSGVGYKAIPDISNEDPDNNWDIVCVRGPITAEILGIDKSKSVTDSAIVARLLFDIVPYNKRKNIAFMPHISSRFNGVWKDVCDHLGIEYLDPTLGTKMLIRKISSSEIVIADAMHAAVVADTMRVPWIPVVTSVEINIIKWLDWTKSMSVNYRPYYLPQSCLYEWIKNRYFISKSRGYGSLWKKVSSSGNITDEDIEDIVDNYMNMHDKWSTHAEFSEESLDSNVEGKKRDTGKLLKNILGLKLIKVIIYPIERILFNRACAKMKIIMESEAYLSSDEIYDEKLSRMKELLEDIKVKYSDK